LDVVLALNEAAFGTEAEKEQNASDQ